MCVGVHAPQKFHQLLEIHLCVQRMLMEGKASASLLRVDCHKARALFCELLTALGLPNRQAKIHDLGHWWENVGLWGSDVRLWSGGT